MIVRLAWWACGVFVLAEAQASGGPGRKPLGAGPQAAEGPGPQAYGPECPSWHLAFFIKYVGSKGAKA